MDRYNKYQTKQYLHAHTSTLHTQQMMASTWLGDHLESQSAPTNSLHKLYMARYQVLLTYLLLADVEHIQINKQFGPKLFHAEILNSFVVVIWLMWL